MKRRKPLKRKTSLKVKTPNPRKTRVKKVNPERKAREFKRAYGSDARVKWFKAQPCRFCRGGPSDNAHCLTGGAGRKGDADTVLPLCRPCHQAFDGWPATFRREWLLIANEYDAKWRLSTEGHQ